jgi:hypothetical protein
MNYMIINQNFCQTVLYSSIPVPFQAVAAGLDRQYLPKSCITLRVHSLLAHQQAPDGLNKEASLTVHLEIIRKCCD